MYSHGSLSQVTRANFVESELAVAVMTIDPAWGFQEGIETAQLILRSLCNTQYCNQLRGDEIDHAIGIRHLKKIHGGKPGVRNRVRFGSHSQVIEENTQHCTSTRQLCTYMDNRLMRRLAD